MNPTDPAALPTPPAASLRRLAAAEAEAALPGLSRLLADCVVAGASVNFVLPFGPAEAEAFWRARMLGPLGGGRRIVLLAEAGGEILGSVQLDLDTPPNQPHRAEVTKLLVRPEARRRGLARALMRAVEAEARAAGRTLLTLDTRTGDAAEALYRALGYVAAGTIPGYALDPQGRQAEAATIFYKQLAGPSSD